MVGMAKIGRDFINDPAIGFKKVPDEAPVTFHFILSKNWGKSKEVVDIINEQVAEMRKDGQMDKYLKKYGLL